LVQYDARPRGYAICLAGKAGFEFGTHYEIEQPANIYAVSRPDMPIPDFHRRNDAAMPTSLLVRRHRHS